MPDGSRARGPAAIGGDERLPAPADGRRAGRRLGRAFEPVRDLFNLRLDPEDHETVAGLKRRLGGRPRDELAVGPQEPEHARSVGAREDGADGALGRRRGVFRYPELGEELLALRTLRREEVDDLLDKGCVAASAIRRPAMRYGEITRFAPAVVSRCSPESLPARATMSIDGLRARAVSTVKALTTSESGAGISARARSTPARASTSSSVASPRRTVCPVSRARSQAPLSRSMMRSDSPRRASSRATS